MLTSSNTDKETVKFRNIAPRHREVRSEERKFTKHETHIKSGIKNCIVVLACSKTKVSKAQRSTHVERGDVDFVK